MTATRTDQAILSRLDPATPATTGSTYSAFRALNGHDDAQL